MAAKPAPAKIDDNRADRESAKLRAWRAHRQGLDGSLQGKSSAEILAASGWARSVAGVCPYMTLFARGGVSREAADQAAANVEIHELPSARGCTYVLPASDFGLGLRVGQGFADEATLKTAYRLGVTPQEIDKLCGKVLAALAAGPLDPEGLKEACGSAVRNLGEEGKKKGVTTTLPPVLQKLQQLGKIRRIPVNGRLDQQRYRYSIWESNPLDTYKVEMEEAYTALARRYFSWIGPASLAEFQWFSGLSGKVARKAIAPLNLETVSAPQQEPERFMLPGEAATYRDFQPPDKPTYSFVSSLDGILQLRRNAADLLAPGVQVDLIEGVADLPSHAIFDRGVLIGLWEFDPEAGELVWKLFDGPRGKSKPDKALRDSAGQTEAFIRDQLGDARSFSLDSPKSRAPRIEQLRNA